VSEQARPYVFVPDTPALNAVSVTRVQFNTLSVDSTGKVDSRSCSGGVLDFAVLHADGAPQQAHSTFCPSVLKAGPVRRRALASAPMRGAH